MRDSSLRKRDRTERSEGKPAPARGLSRMSRRAVPPPASETQGTPSTNYTPWFACLALGLVVGFFARGPSERVVEVPVEVEKIVEAENAGRTFAFRDVLASIDGARTVKEKAVAIGGLWLMGAQIVRTAHLAAGKDAGGLLHRDEIAAAMVFVAAHGGNLKDASAKSSEYTQMIGFPD